MKFILKDFSNVVENVEIYNDSFPFPTTTRGIIHLENSRTLKSIIPDIKVELGIPEDKEIFLCTREFNLTDPMNKLTEISNDLNVENLISSSPLLVLVIITKDDMTKYNEYIDNIQCPICFESLRNGMELSKLNCNHVFHENCISRWRDTCPSCRALISNINRVNPRNYKDYLHNKRDGKRKSTKKSIKRKSTKRKSIKRK